MPFGLLAVFITLVQIPAISMPNTCNLLPCWAAARLEGPQVGEWAVGTGNCNDGLVDSLVTRDAAILHAGVVGIATVP